jgi:hypothetical protein
VALSMKLGTMAKSRYDITSLYLAFLHIKSLKNILDNFFNF